MRRGQRPRALSIRWAVALQPGMPPDAERRSSSGDERRRRAVLSPVRHNVGGARDEFASATFTPQLTMFGFVN